MSSRRLLILLEHLPEDSAFKTALRDGDWPRHEHLTTGVLNEIKALRSDMWAFNHDHLPFKPILPPSTERAAAQTRAAARKAHDDLMAQLRGGTG